MKKIRIISLLAFLFVVGTSVYSQTSFTVEWNGCKVTSDSSRYNITFAVYNTTTSTYVILPTTISNILPSASSWVIPLSYDCNQADTKPYIYIFVRVELKDGDGNTYCTGDARSDLLTCAEMYGSTTITVNMQ